MQAIILPKEADRARPIARIAAVLAALDRKSAWKVEISEHRPRRTSDQNRLLWAIYGEILEKGGEDMGGWTKDDLHEFFLIQHFGAETKDLFGRKRLVPLLRSSKLNKQQFADLIETILRFMAERGVWIQTPEGRPCSVDSFV